MTWSWNRILSALVALVYVVGAALAGGAEGGCKMGLVLILPLACIWFSEAMGGYTGPTTSMPITAPSPGIMVCILGWVILLLPGVFVIIAWLA
jgi:hypothetical protein